MGPYSKTLDLRTAAREWLTAYRRVVASMDGVPQSVPLSDLSADLRIAEGNLEDAIERPDPLLAAAREACDAWERWKATGDHTVTLDESDRIFDATVAAMRRLRDAVAAQGGSNKTLSDLVNRQENRNAI